ncbi:DUF4857 domain-containing protein [Roseospira visakhapatnamensis]|uniref:DUF4857 domain-containing protein n=1 Tax=Roseospira visakhapatnamensis TaxID=390880 RepID=A0A7W6WAI2_9PROT|nr:DUF4857 domain-containing protein [Roseospira visakhapatnamensis]MBB4266522.1 hypothetical protein [Roseospira visakhapatnamensis]
MRPRSPQFRAPQSRAPLSRPLGWLTLALLLTGVSAIALPRLYDLAFAVDVAPTHLFYSPVREAFVFREHRGNHAFTYADEHGETFDRQTFEQQIPFIYYRNMALWGLLPLTLEGRTFDADTIRDARQVFELKAREIADRRPSIAVYPLLESNPGRARLRFPEDVFRMTDNRMEFLNVDVNRVDAALTALFTEALTAEGFAFPARLVAGKPTILKPFDEGYLIVDAEGVVFHVKRTDGQPRVVRTPIPADLGRAIRHIKVTENERREILGLVLTDDDRLFLLRAEDYGLIPLPTDGYVPDRMDAKLLINPLYPTVVFGDDAMVHAVAMTPDFDPVASYSRPVPGTRGLPHDVVAGALFPFTLSLDDHGGAFLTWRLDGHGWAGLIGIAGSLLLVLGMARARRAPWRAAAPVVALVALTGVFGLLAALLVPWPRDDRASLAPRPAT